MTVFEDLHLLRAFVRIAEAGSISAAARSLGLTQPTASRYLQTLEERSGTQLLYRDTHRTRLTPAGHQLLEDARAILSMAEEANQRLLSSHVKVTGQIRIFSTIDFGQNPVSRLVASFLQANPGVTATLAYSNRPILMIEEGCDAGIIAGELTDDTVIARPVGSIRRQVVASPQLIRTQEPVTSPAQLGRWPWLSLSSPHFDAGETLTLHGPGGARHDLSLSPVLTSEGVTSLREAARMHLGAAALPEWLIAADLVNGSLQPVLPGWRPKDLAAHVIYPVQRRLPARVRAFIEFATAYMGTVLAPTGAAAGPSTAGATEIRYEGPKIDS